MPLWFRHPFRWRQCVRDSELARNDGWGGIDYSPGQLYTIRYGARSLSRSDVRAWQRLTKRR